MEQNHDMDAATSPVTTWNGKCLPMESLYVQVG